MDHFEILHIFLKAPILSDLLLLNIFANLI